MKFLRLLAALLVALLLIACSQEPPPAEPQGPSTVQPSQPAPRTAEQMAGKVEKEVKETVAAVKQEAEAVKQEIAQETVAVKEQAAITEQVKEAATDAAQQVQQAVPALAGVKPAPGSPASAPLANAPATVAYQAIMGTVTFNHAAHAGKFACSRCHTTDPPQKIVMDKEVAHNQLCKVCHKENGGQAPTACAGCHKK